MASKKEQKEEARRQREEREAEERRKARRTRRLWQVGAVVVVAAAIVIIAVLVSSSGGGGSSAGGSAKGAPNGSQHVAQMLAGIPQSGVTLGRPNAPVTVTEFADLKCPICKAYTLTTQDGIITNYVRPGKAKFIFRNLAFVGASQADTQAAAIAATAAAQQNKLWNFADVFYHNQGDENSDYVTDAFIKKIASGVPGLDAQKLLADRNSPAAQQLLETASNEASKYKVTGTPTFVVQTKSGKQTIVSDYTKLSAALDAATKAGT